MESRSGKQVATLTLDIPVSSNIPKSSDTFQSTWPKRKQKKFKTHKSPSTLRRDSKRFQDFQAKKETSQPKIQTLTSTPTTTKFKLQDSLDYSPILQKNVFKQSDDPESEIKFCSLINSETPIFQNVIFKDFQKEPSDKNENDELIFTDEFKEDILKVFNRVFDKHEQNFFEAKDKREQKVKEAIENSETFPFTNKQEEELHDESESFEGPFAKGEHSKNLKNHLTTLANLISKNVNIL